MSEAQIIDGKAFAARLRERVAAAVATLKENHGLTPSLTVVLVGSSETRAIPRGDGRSWVYTPRGYAGKNTEDKEGTG